jgi:hypothetical protein
MRVQTAIAALSLASLMLLSAGPALAHQPVVVDSDTTEVVDPEISKAYYGVLSGAAHTYVITSDIEFDLYVGILVPDSEMPKRDVKAEIFRGDELVETLGVVDAEWVTFYEPFAQNTYWGRVPPSCSAWGLLRTGLKPRQREQVLTRDRRD